MKTQKDLDNLKHSCKILMSCHRHLGKMIKPGVKASELDNFFIEYGKKHGAEPNFLGYQGFKHAITCSIDDEVVHGLSGDDKIIPDNCLVSIDAGYIYKGMHCDAARTYIVGDPGEKAKQLVKAVKDGANAGISKIKSGIRLGDIGNAIDKVAKEQGFGNVYELGGHGVGYVLHDDPFIPHQGRKGKGPKLFENKVIAIEPMFTLGGSGVVFDKSSGDGWTVKTEDGSLAAHWEENILVTRDGYEILTDIPDHELFDD